MADLPTKLEIPLCYETGERRFDLDDPEPDTKTPLRLLTEQPKFAAVTVELTYEQIDFLAHCAYEAKMQRLGDRLHFLKAAHGKATGQRFRLWAKLQPADSIQKGLRGNDRNLE